jgi:hypothetical protein
MREQLDAVARAVSFLKKKSLAIEDENIKPGFDKAVAEMEAFFNQCYVRMKRHSNDEGLHCVVGKAAKQLRKSMNNK